VKEGIHPNYIACKVSCACGNVFTTHSLKPEIKLEICSACHPFFTGKQKFVDTEGRIDKFLKKLDQAKTHKETVSKIKKTKVTAKIPSKLLKQDSKKAKTLSSRPVASPKTKS